MGADDGGSTSYVHQLIKLVDPEVLGFRIQTCGQVATGNGFITSLIFTRLLALLGLFWLLPGRASAKSKTLDSKNSRTKAT
jgi:hypothetical protein